MIKNRIAYFISLIFTLPAVIIGAIAMNLNNIPLLYPTLNIIFLLVGWLISSYVISRNSKIRISSNNEFAIIVLIIVFYILTFIDAGADGVHRWLTLGPISLYISSIFVPLLLIELWLVLKKNKDILVGVITILVAILLILQPDASQLTAFTVPMMLMFFTRVKNRKLSYFVISILLSLTIISWKFLDSLPPVIYVEDIVSLVIEMGLVWSLLGIASLIIIPMPFLLLSNGSEGRLTRYLALHFSILIISTLFGNFPVPLMGYGISPILGYLIAITWVMRNQRDI